MNKDKLISLLIKKQSYKQTRSIILQIQSQNKYSIDKIRQSIRNSITAIQQILTKQYNSESKLYALRYLKDCFQMGSKSFIKAVDQGVLPILINIVNDSIDQTAITKYAGSSFTKTADLTKFKSIMVSFFMLAKQCISKWASWLSGSDYKFNAALISLQRKGINFESQFKYFREQNQKNFIKNCKQNGIQIALSKPTQSQVSIISQKSSIKPVKDLGLTAKQNIESNQFKLGERSRAKGKNKQIMQCYKIFNNYDKKLQQRNMNDTDLQQMNNKINHHLNQYMQTPGLNQRQMQDQMTELYRNIKFITNDYQKMKKINMIKPKQNSQLRPIQNTIKKTQPLIPNKSQLVTPNIKLFDQPQPIQKKQKYEQRITKIRQNNVRLQSTNKIENNQQKRYLRRQKIQKMKERQHQKQQKCTQINQIKSNQTKKQKFDDCTDSFVQSNIISDKPQNNIKSEKPQSIIKSEKPQNKTQFNNKSLLKQQSKLKDSKINEKQKFDNSNLDISKSQQSRVNFSDSDSETQSRNESVYMTNFKKQKDNKLSSIEQQQDHQGQTSRRVFKQKQQPFKPAQQLFKPTQQLFRQKQQPFKQKKQPFKQKQQLLVQQQVFGQKSVYRTPRDLIKQSKVQSESNKIQTNIVKQYEQKIFLLQNQLQNKSQLEKKMQNRLLQLSQVKTSQEKQLQIIKFQNHQILKQMTNAVNAQQYDQVKKEFIDIKKKNDYMEKQMANLLIQIQNLKAQQKQMANQKQDFIKLQVQKREQLQKILIKRHDSAKKILHAKVQLQSQLVSLSVKQKPEVPEYTIQRIDQDYSRNLTHYTKVKNILNENNLMLLKRSLTRDSELFFTNQLVSVVCRKQQFNQQNMTLKIDLSIQINHIKPLKPNITYINMEEIDIWKKNIVGQDKLYHQEIVVKVKKFPFKLMKMKLSLSQHQNTQLLVPYLYYSFLRSIQFTRQQFGQKFNISKDLIIKSKILTLNPKVIKDLGQMCNSHAFYKLEQNSLRFKLNQNSHNLFYCQILMVNRLKCFIKILPQPFNSQMQIKAEQLIGNLTFILAL